MEKGKSIEAFRAALDAAPATPEQQGRITDYARGLLRDYGTVIQVGVIDGHYVETTRGVNERVVNTPYASTLVPDVALFVTGTLHTEARELKPTAIVFNELESRQFNGETIKLSGKNTVLFNFEDPLSAHEGDQALRILEAIRDGYVQHRVPIHHPLLQDLSSAY